MFLWLIGQTRAQLAEYWNPSPENLWDCCVSYLFVGRGHHLCTQLINLLSTSNRSERGWQRGRKTDPSVKYGWCFIVVFCFVLVFSTKTLSEKWSSLVRCFHLTFKSSESSLILSAFCVTHFPSESGPGSIWKCTLSSI